jgi:hypothetical protein
LAARPSVETVGRAGKRLRRFSAFLKSAMTQSN